MVKTQYTEDFVQENAVTPMNTEYTYRLKLRNGLKSQILKLILVIILINIPSILVINPPIRRIKVDFINVFFIFILNFMIFVSLYFYYFVI